MSPLNRPSKPARVLSPQPERAARHRESRAAEDETPHRLIGRAGLVFAYVCFAIAIATIGGAIYLLPISFKVKLFLGAATLLLISLFAFMAYATHIVVRTRPPD